MAYRIYNTLMKERPETFKAALRRDHAATEAFGELAL
jgi:hypothetical protein